MHFVLYVDSALWLHVMKTTDHQPDLLRWYLRLKKFDFVVQDTVNVHTLSDPDQAKKKGQALELKRALLGRQPKLLFPLLPLAFLFTIFLVCEKKIKKKNEERKEKRKLCIKH